MLRPPLEVADVIRAAGRSFVDRCWKWFSRRHLKVLNAILACRTAGLGGHVDECTRCGYRTISFNSCRNWVVYAKRPFGGAEHVLHYLGAYTHRIAISNHRLVRLADGMVIFRWRDSAHKNKKRLARLAVDEFLRRFFLHVLPCGFVRIRYFGFLAHRRRAELLPQCFALLAAAQSPPAETGPSHSDGLSPFRPCPLCQGPMIVVERLTPAEARLRSPPEGALLCS